MPPYNESSANSASLMPMSTTPGGHGGNNMVKSAGPQDQIAMEFNGLDEATAYLLDRLSLLRIRLSPVLLDSPMKEGGSMPTPPMAPIANAVRNQRNRVEEAKNIVNGILNDLSL
jgi:hypothetical protein